MCPTHNNKCHLIAVLHNNTCLLYTSWRQSEGFTRNIYRMYTAAAALPSSSELQPPIVSIFPFPVSEMSSFQRLVQFFSPGSSTPPSSIPKGLQFVTRAKHLSSPGYRECVCKCETLKIKNVVSVVHSV